jgi:kynurenine formamidase
MLITPTVPATRDLPDGDVKHDVLNVPSIQPHTHRQPNDDDKRGRSAGRYGLENIVALEKRPPRNFLLIVAPIKIVTGTGGPTRLFAVLPLAQK